LQALREKHEAGAEYLSKINPALWVEAFFPGQRHGHDTSNIVETQNSAMKIDRELPILILLDTLYHKIMENRAQRLQTARQLVEAGKITTHFVENVLHESPQWASANQA
jgi:hypothetical protein